SAASPRTICNSSRRRRAVGGRQESQVQRRGWPVARSGLLCAGVSSSGPRCTHPGLVRIDPRKKRSLYETAGIMPSLEEIIRESQIWKSIFRHPAPIDRRNRVVVMLTNFFLHLHPVSIKKQGIALSYTWCMGRVTFFLFLVETITGVLLMFYYRPTIEWAYNDIL